MTVFNKKEPYVLVIGDVFVLVFSLWLTLVARFLSLPSQDLFLNHLMPFSIIFGVWIVVFFIAGLYEKQTAVTRRALPSSLILAYVANSVIAVLFFYLIPYFGIAPKVSLFIDLIISLGGLALWRLALYPVISVGKSERAVLIANGKEAEELADELRHNNRHGIFLVSIIDPNIKDLAGFEKILTDMVKKENITLVILDAHNDCVEPILPVLYNFIFEKVRFVDFNSLYEAIFIRLPVSLIKHNWFLANMSIGVSAIYDVLKRLVDFVAAFILFIISLVFYPFVFIGTKISDGGSMFFHQQRVGKNNKIIYILKFRTMSDEKKLKAGHKGDEGVKRVTTFGSFLRKTRIDELPQLWNVLKGDISLIGPRPEMPEMVAVYEKEIPYYNVRHLVTPGLSGWAQMYHQNHPHHDADVLETQNKLSYDLYYIKNRSFLLDIIISLKTLKTLITFVGK